MSGAEYFDDANALNSYMDDSVAVDLSKAIQEHAEIRECFEKAGIEIVKIDAPSTSQDGVYTANWALIRGNKAVMSNLPNKRKSEEDYARKQLDDLGFETIKLPEQYRFSGQGDALAFGNLLFMGTSYRTSPEVHTMVAQELGYEIISVQTIPELGVNGKPVINKVSGWPDSFFYDIDLAIAIIKAPIGQSCSHNNDAACGCPGIIAWCPDAFTPESQEKIRSLSEIDMIEVDIDEAMGASACNLVSTGDTIIMSGRAPKLRKELESRGFKIFAPKITELMKGGGFIRCCSLTLDNV